MATYSECPGADSNRHAFRRHPLKMVCLPVPPLPHFMNFLNQNGFSDLCPRCLPILYMAIFCYHPLQTDPCMRSRSRSASFKGSFSDCRRLEGLHIPYRVLYVIVTCKILQREGHLCVPSPSLETFWRSPCNLHLDVFYFPMSFLIVLRGPRAKLGGAVLQDC